MEGFCRACLVKFDELECFRQYSEKNRRLFVYATGIQVKRNDNINFQICSDCYNSLNNACVFKKTCRNSDKKIRSYFGLKEDGESLDFSTFLKNSDNTFRFRLPDHLGNSTPANQRKDDDNESTCTSIQNFMTDILQAEEIPDNEARIIREVIAEEADILEDSLDSAWLQDDISMDADYRLDFSFSPFSTPPVTNDDHSYTPIKQSQDRSRDTDKNSPAVRKVLDKHYDVKSIPPQKILESNFDTGKDMEKENKMCTIDFNLENALKNIPGEKVPLDILLATPPVQHGVSGPSTPLIKNILFGDRVDEDETKMNREEMDVIDEFLTFNDTKEQIEIYDINDIVDINKDIELAMEGKKFNEVQEQVIDKTDERLATGGATKHNLNEMDVDVKSVDKIESPKKVLSAQENKYCITNYYCKMCNRQFKNLKALKIHCAKHHKFKINTVKAKQPRQQAICDYCGKIFASSRCIIRHIENHMKPSEYTCPYCTLKFSASYRLKLHLTTHIGKKVPSALDKRHVCAECGKAFTALSSYRTHVSRHRGGTTRTCPDCGKGFYRNSDLAVHMRRHTGERPFACVYCPRTFARTDSLNRHMKLHTGEKPFPCTFCNKSFPKPYELKAHQNTKACLQIQLETAELQRVTDDDLTELLTDVT